MIQVASGCFTDVFAFSSAGALLGDGAPTDMVLAAGTSIAISLAVRGIRRTVVITGAAAILEKTQQQFTRLLDDFLKTQNVADIFETWDSVPERGE